MNLHLSGRTARKKTGIYMRKTKQIIISALIALLIAGVILAVIFSRQAPVSQKVLAAATDIPAGTRISQQDLVWIDYPVDLSHSQIVTELAQAVGQFAKADLYQHEIILSERIGPQTEGIQYPQAAPGRRLLTLRLKPERANGLWLAAGNLIDLTLIPKNHHDTDDIIHMENIEIIAVFQDQPPSQGKPAGINTDALVCLDLTQEQALLIHALIDQCHVRIAAINEPKEA